MKKEKTVLPQEEMFELCCKWFGAVAHLTLNAQRTVPLSAFRLIFRQKAPLFGIIQEPTSWQTAQRKRKTFLLLQSLQTSCAGTFLVQHS